MNYLVLLNSHQTLTLSAELQCRLQFPSIMSVTLHTNHGDLKVCSYHFNPDFVSTTVQIEVFCEAVPKTAEVLASP